MQVVILTSEQGSQIALSNKIAEKFEVAAVVLSRNIPKRKPSLSKKAKQFIDKIQTRTFGRQLVSVWHKVQRDYQDRYTDLPDTEIIRVENINHKESFEAINRHKPDLVVVSGTNLVGRRIIRAAKKRLGIVNLHTGISPYVKGGPNCTNWCLAKGWFHLIGNTIMWLNLGIDTGNIIATERTPLDGSESLFELHWKVMEHAHDLYLRSLSQFADGRTVPSVPQDDIDEGNLFYTADWNAMAMRNAYRNYCEDYSRFFRDDKNVAALIDNLKLVSLDDTK